MHKCQNCGQAATHIVVNYRHEVLNGGELYCSFHAFDDGREQCPCCYDYQIDFDDQEFLPTYPQGTLDSEGCCSEHP